MKTPNGMKTVERNVQVQVIRKLNESELIVALLHSNCEKCRAVDWPTTCK